MNLLFFSPNKLLKVTLNDNDKTRPLSRGKEVDGIKVQVKIY